MWCNFMLLTILFNFCLDLNYFYWLKYFSNYLLSYYTDFKSYCLCIKQLCSWINKYLQKYLGQCIFIHNLIIKLVMCSIIQPNISLYYYKFMIYSIQKYYCLLKYFKLHIIVKILIINKLRNFMILELCMFYCKNNCLKY